MSDAFAFLYGLSANFKLGELVADFASKGIVLKNPSSDIVTAISEYGDQLQKSLDNLEAELTASKIVSFQFWLDGGTDLYCRLRHLHETRIVEEYALDGLLPQEKERVINVLVERFKAKAKLYDAIFFILDRAGGTVEVAWDDVSISGGYEFIPCPDILGIPQVRLINFKKCAAESEVIPIGKYVLIQLKN